MSTPNLKLVRYIENQQSGFATINNFLNRLDAIIQTTVLSRATTPPDSPSEGDRYLIIATATGVWTGKENQIAAYYSGWQYFSPLEGWLCYVQDENVFYSYNNGWNISSISRCINTTTDYNPPPIADSTINISSITVSGAALGDYVLVAAPYDLQGLQCTAYVSAANTIKIVLFNLTGGTIDLPNGTWNIKIIKPS